MHRLGFYREQLPELLSTIAGTAHNSHASGALSTIRIASVFSHLAGSDEAQFDAFTREQIAYFRDCADYLSGEGGPIRHILNSAGIERFTDSQFDMCRLGIGMYGFSFNGAKLKNVCTLKTTILSV